MGTPYLTSIHQCGSSSPFQRNETEFGLGRGGTGAEVKKKTAAGTMKFAAINALMGRTAKQRERIWSALWPLRGVFIHVPK
jgi:hypothetical protein